MKLKYALVAMVVLFAPRSGAETRRLIRERIEAIRESAGLNRPFFVQFGDYLWHLVRGDMGNSLVTGRPVFDTIRVAAPVSLQIGVAATIFLGIVGILLGVVAAQTFPHRVEWRRTVGLPCRSL